MFTELGFEPEVAGDVGDRQILLHHCPFRAVASEHTDVVCSMHLGLLKQALADLDAPAEAARLLGFLWAVLAVQVGLLRPRLDRRTRSILAGKPPPRSHQHLSYIALEVSKVVALPALGVVLAAGLLP